MSENNKEAKKNRNGYGRSNSKGRSAKYTARGAGKGKSSRTDDYEPSMDKDKKCGFKTKDASNDVAWYAQNKELLDAAASYSFSNVLGGGTPYTVSNVTPGVMVIKYHAAYNNIVQTTAARNIYSYVRHANSGASNYDAPDLMMYINAVDQAFSFIAWVRRIYGLARIYDQRNRYYPKAIIQSMGVNFGDIMNNLANLWFYIDQITARASVLWIPDNIPVVERHFWMNSNVYMDGDSAKSQTYLFNPTCFYRYNPTLTEVGGGLEPVTVGTNLTFVQIQALGNQLLSVLFEDEDIGIMGGDILKAYGSEHIYTLNPIDASYTVLPTRSDEVLTQIHNCTPVRMDPTNVEQTADGRINTVNMTLQTTQVNSRFYVPHDLTLDFFQAENPTPEQVMVATRLMYGGSFMSSVGTETMITPQYCGTEIADEARIYGLTTAGDAKSLGAFSGMLDPTAYGDLEAFIAAYTTFDWAPFLYFGTASSSEGNCSSRVGDVENFTFINKLNLDKLHTTAIYSEYGIPTM
nr:putative capsid [Marmot picobirnavirus]